MIAADILENQKVILAISAPISIISDHNISVPNKRQLAEVGKGLTESLSFTDETFDERHVIIIIHNREPR